MRERHGVVRVKQRDRASRKNLRPSLQGSNVAVARAVLRALNDAKRRDLSDRARGGGEVPQAVVTKMWLLFACECIATIIPDAVWRELSHNELASAQKAYVVLHRVFHGGRTLPERTQLKAKVKEESCK
jgi:hypothetical protein